MRFYLLRGHSDLAIVCDEARARRTQDLSRAMTVAGPLEWAVFGVVVAFVLVVDLVVARSGGRTPDLRSAALWSAVSLK